MVKINNSREKEKMKLGKGFDYKTFKQNMKDPAYRKAAAKKAKQKKAQLQKNPKYSATGGINKKEIK